MIDNWSHIENKEHREIMHAFWTKTDNSSTTLADEFKITKEVIDPIISKYVHLHFKKFKQ